MIFYVSFLLFDVFVFFLTFHKISINIPVNRFNYRNCNIDGKLSKEFKSIQLRNSSLTVDFATDADEGYYMCQANNGIGPGLKKILHINVNGKRSKGFDTAHFDFMIIPFLSLHRSGTAPLSKNKHTNLMRKPEPARFETASRNVSTRRNDPITLNCLAKGDDHINIIWLHNNNRIDLNNYR